jgi:hypothetical protein
LFSFIITGVLFDVLFNLHKFMRFESRDPFQEKLRREDIFHTDWDRYAHIEYNRLAQEDDDGYDVSMDVDMQNSLAAAGMDTPVNSNGVGNNNNSTDVDSLGNWSLNDEESEDEDEATTPTGGNNKWGQRR